MPLSKDDKANIDLIDAKINKLQEQINNLANSKLYTKVLPDPKIVTKAAEAVDNYSDLKSIDTIKLMLLINNHTNPKLENFGDYEPTDSDVGNNADIIEGWYQVKGKNPADSIYFGDNLLQTMKTFLIQLNKDSPSKYQSDNFGNILTQKNWTFLLSPVVDTKGNFANHNEKFKFKYWPTDLKNSLVNLLRTIDIGTNFWADPDFKSIDEDGPRIIEGGTFNLNSDNNVYLNISGSTIKFTQNFLSKMNGYGEEIEKGNYNELHWQINEGRMTNIVNFVKNLFFYYYIYSKYTPTSSSTSSSTSSLSSEISKLRDQINRKREINSTQEQNSNEALSDAGKRASDTLSEGVKSLAKVNKYNDYEFTIDLMNIDENVNILDNDGKVISNFPYDWPIFTNVPTQLYETDEDVNNLNYQVEKLEGEKYGINDPYVVSYHLYFQINRDENYNWSTDYIGNVTLLSDQKPDFYHFSEPKENINDPYDKPISSDLFITKYYNNSGKLQTSVLEFFPEIDTYKYKYLAKIKLKKILPKNDPKLEKDINSIKFPDSNPEFGFKISRYLKETVYFNKESTNNVLYTDEIKLFYEDNSGKKNVLFTRTKTKEWNNNKTGTTERSKKLTSMFKEFFEHPDFRIL